MKRMEIAPGVHLSWDPAQKFNRCRVSIHFALPAKRETATAHALLPLVMERGYADCPDMTQLTKKLARLYGADLTVDARPMGANHNLCVSVTGIKDQFALEGEPLTQEYAELALGTAFHPYFVGETFDPEAVKIEKQMLKKALEDMTDLLNPGGRLAVLTFHSLEDRIVKQTFRRLANPCTCPPKIPVCICGKKPVVRVLGGGGVKPDAEEVERNPRARSAMLRGCEKLETQA